MSQVYPSSIESRGDPGLMHFAAINIVDAGMVPYLCSIAPQLLHNRDTYGRTPLHHYKASRGRCAKALTMCEMDPTVARDETAHKHRLPLHALLSTKRACESPTTDFGDCFRQLLRLHPLSAGALDISGVSSISFAIEKKMDDYFIRLLLSSSTDAAHEALLLEYNHKNRRGLLFLSLSALSLSPQPTIFARLRQSHRESLRVVASFL